MEHQHIKIAVRDSDGVEHVPAQALENGEWQLIRSPLYAMDVASGDILRILDDATGSFEIKIRGGNVCVQFYLAGANSDNKDLTSTIAKEISEEIGPLGGQTDALTAGLIAFTVPVRVGFNSIEKVFQSASARYPGAQWQYSNIYDPDTGEPLNWWL